MKRIILSVTILLIACIVLTSCDKETASQSLKEISVMCYDNQVALSEGSMEENRWTKWMNQETGIKINWIPIPGGAEMSKKINLLYATGEAPDVSFYYERNFCVNLVRQGSVKPLDSFIDEYSTAYKEYINSEENKELKDYTKVDNVTYFLTSRRDMSRIASTGAWIRQDYLDKYGLKMPNTVDEFLNVARTLKKNGHEIPISIINWSFHMMDPFFASGWYIKADGSGLERAEETQRYIDCLRFAKTMYEEGLIDKEFFTDKNATNQKAYWANGESGILLNIWKADSNKELIMNNPDAKPVPMPPLETKYGRNGYRQYIPPRNFIMFSENNKDPKTSMQFIDWMLDKGWHTLFYGNEGEHYKLVDGVPVSILDQATIDLQLKYAAGYALLDQNNIQPDWYIKTASDDRVSKALARQNADSLAIQIKYPYRVDLSKQCDDDVVTKATNEYWPNRDTIVMKVVAGGPEYTPEWGAEEIKKEWLRVGGEEAFNTMNSWYLKNK